MFSFNSFKEKHTDLTCSYRFPFLEKKKSNMTFKSSLKLNREFDNLVQ